MGRTAHDPSGLTGPLILIDANGMAAQHTPAQTFTLWNSRTARHETFDRPDAWWTLNMSHGVDRRTIQFPVEVVWEQRESAS